MNVNLGARTAEPVELKFEIRASDLLRANSWWLMRRWYVSTAYALVAAVVLYTLPPLTVAGFESADLRLFILPFAFFVLVPGGLCWSAWRSVRSLPAKQLQHRYRFADDRLQIDTGISSAIVEWEAVQQVVERRTAFYVFLHKSIFHVVPKRGLQASADLDRLRALLRTILGSKARLRSDSGVHQA